MPVRSLNSPVLVWPSPAEVIPAVVDWARSLARRRPEIERIGYFGSYARGSWGVGSDVDLVVVVTTSEERFERRSLPYDASKLPVDADVLVYTPAELATKGSFLGEVVWVYRRRAARAS